MQGVREAGLTWWQGGMAAQHAWVRQMTGLVASMLKLVHDGHQLVLVDGVAGLRRRARSHRSHAPALHSLPGADSYVQGDPCMQRVHR